MKIRNVSFTDRDEWARMRNSLWSDSLEEHIEYIDKYFTQQEVDIVEVFIIERSNGKLGGFIELNIRNYAEGTASTQVPYIEGWYIDSDIRGKGYGKKLIENAQNWAIANGFEELASDAEIDNEISITAHKALGFEEVDRIVCFLKKLK
ncbi:MAG: GNAT family N-acetyltransferase [Cyanobacteria bacterium P01_A01_bin.84]